MPRVSKGTRECPPSKPQSIPGKFKPGFLAEMDGRKEIVKTLRANYETIVNDLGGADDVSHVKGALVERFVWLEAILQTLEHSMANGDTTFQETLGKWTQAVNSLNGLARILGIERLQPSVTLSEYTKKKTNGESK